MTSLPDDFASTLNANLGGFEAQLGMRFLSASPESVTATLEVTPELLQPYGLVHGGVYCSVIETVCSVGAALHAMQRGDNAVGLENHTSFLRAVRSGTLIAHATPLRRGRRSQVWEAEIHDDQERLVASGRVRLLCLEPGASAGGQEVRLPDDS